MVLVSAVNTVLRFASVALLLGAVGGCASPPMADPASDAPETASPSVAPFVDAPSYAEALGRWRSVEEVNGWIGARFRYDHARAIKLSETQRKRSGRLPIAAPEAFFAAPSGVCVDLSRFAVETLRVIDPALDARYLMIEFDPLELRGNTLRRHWIATYVRDGQHFYFADSKRPGHIAGPYASSAAFAADYARYRGRTIVAIAERDSYERTLRTAVPRSRTPIPSGPR